MKILLVMDPGILVPPKGYGGHERLVAMFAREYLRLGHEVHLLVTEGSEIPGCIVHPLGKEGFPINKEEARAAIFRAWRFLRKHKNDFDLIHNFGRLFYLLPVLNHPIKKIMTYGREISSRNIRITNSLPNKNLVFTGCSNNLISRVKAGGNWKTVYNAIEFSKYTLVEKVTDDAPFMFLGRVEELKGCHTAIEAALATNSKLIIAGNVSNLEHDQQYYKTKIEPYLDGKQIVHVGAVNDEQKNHYLGQSKALLFPIQWNEPFGMVMVEAMACGTPVLGFKVGSVDEVIDEGITGYKIHTKEEMIEAVGKLDKIDRKTCREKAFERFDVSVIAKTYLSLFD